MPADYQPIGTPHSMTSNWPVMKRIGKSIHPWPHGAAPAVVYFVLSSTVFTSKVVEVVTPRYA